MTHSNLRIDGARLISRLMALAQIGATPEGGCRRLALSDETRRGVTGSWQKCVHWACVCMSMRSAISSAC